MGRRIFHFWAAASLILWIAVAVLFVRSFWVEDAWARTYSWNWDRTTDLATRDSVDVEITGGRLMVDRFHLKLTNYSGAAEIDLLAKRGTFFFWTHYHQFDPTGSRSGWYWYRFASRTETLGNLRNTLFQASKIVEVPPSPALPAIPPSHFF